MGQESMRLSTVLDTLSTVLLLDHWVCRMCDSGNQSCLICDWLVSAFLLDYQLHEGCGYLVYLWTLRTCTEPGSYNTLSNYHFRGKRRKVMWAWARDLEGRGSPGGLVVGIRSWCPATATPSVPTGNKSGTLEQGSWAQSWTLYRWLV